MITFRFKSEKHRGGPVPLTTELISIRSIFDLSLYTKLNLPICQASTARRSAAPGRPVGEVAA